MPANLKILMSMLLEQGHQVRPAINGQVALTAIQEATPDLILLDIAMPGLDGYEICRYLKANERTCDIPIIFISARDETEDKIKAFSMGGIDYITKPFHVEEVLTRVNTHLTLRRLQKNLQEKNAQLEEKNKQLQEKNAELQEALDNIKTLKGLIPICSNCKKIRDDEGYWQDVAVYIRDHSEAEFSHGICPDCIKELYPEYYKSAKDAGKIK
jgi:DNA-binding response OmpR family regulator